MTEPVPAESDIYALNRGVRLHYDRRRETWVLMAPERAIFPDSVALAVLEKIDGVQSFGTILDRLASEFSAPREEIKADCLELFYYLCEARLIRLVRPS